jgi:methanogenic corrinoid protein MtbC1
MGGTTSRTAVEDVYEDELRERFALAVAPAFVTTTARDETTHDYPAKIARLAWDQADALVAEYRRRREA